MGKLNWNPWMGMEEFKEEMDRMMEEVFSDPDSVRSRQNGGFLWQPQADVYEGEAAVVLTVELPGVGLRDIVLETRGRELWVYGERRFEKGVQDMVYHALERSYGPFARKFLLPKECVASAARAVLKNGLLTVTVPKASQLRNGTRIVICEK